MNILSRIFTPRQAATVPSMDGVLRPNEALDALPAIGEIPEPDNLVMIAGEIILSSGHNLFSLAADQKSLNSIPYKSFASNVTALAASAQGALAVGLEDNGIQIVGGQHDQTILDSVGNRAASCVTAIAFHGEDELFICLGSKQNKADDWQRDLLEKRASGSVWRFDLNTQKASLIADNLAFPNGVFVQDNSLIISESWKHRLLKINLNDKKLAQEIVIGDMPGYPGRLAPAANGGVWLSVFAPRRQLTEFVLREDAYRNRMLNELSREHWIAPTLRAGKSFTEPMQGGAVKVHGIHKAWAPTRSYGLLILLDANMAPTHSYHSRADGKRHGIVSVCEVDGQVIIASRGDEVICSLNAPHSDQELNQ